MHFTFVFVLVCVYVQAFLTFIRSLLSPVQTPEEDETQDNHNHHHYHQHNSHNGHDNAQHYDQVSGRLSLVHGGRERLVQC